MRAFLILSLALSFEAFAEESFETSLKGIETKKEKAIEKWQKDNGFDPAKLSPPEKVREYVRAYSSIQVENYNERLKFYDEACKTDKKYCLTSQQRKTESSKLSVTLGVLNKKVEWIAANKNATPEQIAVAFPEETVQKIETPKPAERSVASEPKVNETVSPTPKAVGAEVEVAPKAVGAEVEVAPKAVGAEVEVAPKAVGAEVEVAPKAVGAEVAVAPKAEESDFEAQKEEVMNKLNADVKILVEEFQTKFPKFGEEINGEMFEAFKEFQAKQLGMVLKSFQELCTKFPKDPNVCLNEERVAAIAESSLGNICYNERLLNYSTNNQSKIAGFMAFEEHEKEWDALPGPKQCQALIDKDKTKPVAPEAPAPQKTAQTQETASSDDEKSPRNYNAETCRWVKDMPRKIVNGPGCTTAGRTQMCVGYVVCEQKEGGGKFVRMSTCGADKCGHQDSEAVNCTKDLNYFSSRPIDEAKHFVSPALKQIFSSEQ